MSTPPVATIEDLRRVGYLRPLDVHFARALARIGSDSDEDVQLAAACASRHVGAGHTCVDLAVLAESRWIATEAGEALPAPPWPDLPRWIERLHQSPVVASSDEHAACPMVLDGHKLYLRRYWLHQRRLAAALRRRIADATPDGDRVALEKSLERLFPGDTTSAEQREAAADAVQRHFSVVSGGPGTGKTTTVARILALLLESARRDGTFPLAIELLAPTGKAAARLTESIASAVERLDIEEEVRAAIPTQAKTIHRALGVMGGRNTRFRHDAADPLHADAVVVDEASMVDLALMARLVDALRPDARLILLGDHSQLASVEAGTVLGDICASASEGISFLRESHRYAPDSGVARLAEAVHAGDADLALAALGDPRCEDLSWVVPPKGAGLGAELSSRVGDILRPALHAKSPEERLRRFGRFRILCAHRRGPTGVQAINDEVEAHLASRRLIDRRSPIYPGRPILITRNDYALDLFNGDLGIICADQTPQARRRAYFEVPGEPARALSPARLPPHETVYAMTVHKSQGSEFDEVLIRLPDDPSPITTRELLYTAITRARRRVILCATEERIREAVEQTVSRTSGLREALREPTSPQSSSS